MKAVGEQEIRRSFVNCSQGEAKRLPVPRDLAEHPWDDLDFLGWRDPRTPERNFIVVERDGRLVGVTLRAAQRRGSLRSSLCSVCLTTHFASGVALMTARKVGESGRNGNSVGEYMCTDLACSLYLRGKKLPDTGPRMEESLTLEEQVERTKGKLYAFLDRLAS